MMNILHLSDIHFGRNYPEYGIDDDFKRKDAILEELIECISGVETGFLPEHIVVTGDIAWHGKKKDFDEAYAWFSKLLKALDLTGKDITFCVGNHDVNRAYASGFQGLEGSEKKKENIAEIDALYGYDKIHQLEPPIYEYDRFCERLGVEPYRYPLNGHMEYSYSIGYKDVVFPSCNTIRIFGFNTAALSSLSQFDDDRMWIGQPQIFSLMEYGLMPAPEKDVHYSIALFHHAERYLHPNEICEYDGRVATLPLLRDNVDLILCGHTETGGRPVLQEQKGGGLLLTGGATYYSDTHPNAFSVIYVADNNKKMCFCPYTYNDGWKNYKWKSEQPEIKKIYDLPKLGEIKEQCAFIIQDGANSYTVPMKTVSVYTYNENGEARILIDNRKEVLRELAIECTGGIPGGKVDFHVELAPKMETSVSAMLQREKLFDCIAEAVKSTNDTRYFIRSQSGVNILSGSGVNCKIEQDKFGIELLEKLVKIEQFYDTAFVCPEDIYERDYERVGLLIDLIDKGFTTGLKVGKRLQHSLKDKAEGEKLLELSAQTNMFFLFYTKRFKCSLYGSQFSLGELQIIAGPFCLNIDDLQKKVETFQAEDCRQTIFDATDDNTVYVIRETADENQKNEVLKALQKKYKGEIYPISANALQLNWDFISEITER